MQIDCTVNLYLCRRVIKHIVKLNLATYEKGISLVCTAAFRNWS